ncbi:hypothetical protein PIB30_101369 [Stylosanthes scabra]|uniref:Transposase (putative) gypsy type domain-containing protein n=1 Tax=Stylosanthes scabra TaxID=79078 RepID=A0ABU6VXE5_9FABA|nr:hypothetical protein [Stylosanthes scabra]
MALFSKNWASGLVRNIAPTRELESFGLCLRSDLFDVFRMVCELSDRFSYGDGFSASFIPVDAEVFAQPSVIASDELPELRREMRLTEDVASERDYVLEVVGPSDRLPLQAQEDITHFLWVYVELFTRLGIRLPFTDFQREVLARCRVAASQLQLNGWGILHTFERVCLHFGFRPSWRIFLYTYQLHTPPPRNMFLSFRAYQGR